PENIIINSKSEISFRCTLPKHGDIKPFVIHSSRYPKLISGSTITNDGQVPVVIHGNGAIVYRSISIHILISQISGAPCTSPNPTQIYTVGLHLGLCPV